MQESYGPALTDSGEDNQVALTSISEQEARDFAFALERKISTPIVGTEAFASVYAQTLGEVRREVTVSAEGLDHTLFVHDATLVSPGIDYVTQTTYIVGGPEGPYYEQEMFGAREGTEEPLDLSDNPVEIMDQDIRRQEAKGQAEQLGLGDDHVFTAERLAAAYNILESLRPEDEIPPASSSL